MQRDNSISTGSKRRRDKKAERGVALITTLLLLMLLTGLTLAMAWSSRSDMLINGYYRNFRGSFYAADAGINIMRTAITPLFQKGGAAYPSSFAVGTNPLPASTIADDLVTGKKGLVSKTINALYATGTINSSGTAANSWPGSYTANLTFTQLSCTTELGLCDPTFPAKARTASYVYAYTITATGKSKGTENTQLIDQGRFTVIATIPTPSTLSFAGYGMFVNSSPVCPSDGSTLVGGTITGPVFTNGSWNFGTPTYTFTDSVGQAGSTVGTSNSCPKGATSLPSNVSAKQGFALGQKTITPPGNSFNQEQAVIDGKGVIPPPPAAPPTQSQMNSAMNSALKNISGTAFPSSGTVSSSTPHIFLPYTTDKNGKNPTFTGGGIMVQGDASIVLTPAANGSAQIYTITQSPPVTNSTVTTTITIDPNAGTTTMSSGGTQLTIAGYPQQYDPATGNSMGYDTMLYVNGNITAMSGPGEGKPAIQNGTALTITAADNVTITGDILYTTEPVTGTPGSSLAAEGMPPGTPIDTLIPNVPGGTKYDTGQALGIFTAGGDIQMNNKQTSGNLEIDASIATLNSNNANIGLTNIGSQITTLTIVGGRIQNDVKNIATTQRNVLFDKRFANGFAPPWFPSTGIAAGQNGASLSPPVLTRLQWLNQNNYF